MTAITLLISEELSARLDAAVIKRKAFPQEGATKTQLHEAYKLAEAKGAAAANAYLRTVAPGRVSRMSCLVESITQWVEAEEGKPDDEQAPAVPKKFRIPPKPQATS